ncbi:pre-mRNA-splicing regulator WTAP-like isoform X2 [Artemia franciscana]|uniref:pre-mRNA-splicing regulator WTAP-like isoform X2 n=1 Tax=Artemia franciscana TaxID=6661 RepID=UPI0032D9B594
MMILLNVNKMLESETAPCRILLPHDDFSRISITDLKEQWKNQERYIDWLESKHAATAVELSTLKETEEKLRLQINEATRRENVLVMRLANKEHEVQDIASQIQELKASQTPGAAALRSALLDPAINILVQKLRKELEYARARLEETQNELSAWKFTPDSNTGKRLMAKCRLLYQENEELGKMIASGRLAKLESDLALQRNLTEEMKKSQSELDEYLQELDEDVEGMQSTIYFLQQQLKESKSKVSELQKEIDRLRGENQGYDSDTLESLKHNHIKQEERTTAEALLSLAENGCSSRLTYVDTDSAMKVTFHEISSSDDTLHGVPSIVDEVSSGKRTATPELEAMKEPLKQEARPTDYCETKRTDVPLRKRFKMAPAVSPNGQADSDKDDE